MENTLENIKLLKESLENYCNEIKLDANVELSKDSRAKFIIKINSRKIFNINFIFMTNKIKNLFSFNIFNKTNV